MSMHLPSKVASILSIWLLSLLSLSAELRVVTYNIHHARGNDGQLDLNRIAKVLADQKPDLIALQEVDCRTKRSNGLDQAAEIAKLLGFQHTFAEAIPFENGKYGNAILSRFPIKDPLTLQLEGGPEPRCALQVKVSLPPKLLSPESPATTLWMVSTHLDHTGKSTASQAKQLVETFKACHGPFILAGDFNATRESHILQLLAKNWQINPYAGATHPSEKPNTEIDFILWRGFKATVKSHVIEEKVASDHRPLLSIFSTPE